MTTPVRTSRSRIVSYLNCARLGYLSYDYEGHGLEPVTQSLPLANGIAIHDALAQILTGASPTDVVSKILAEYETTLKSRGVANEDPEGFIMLLREQQCLIAGTIWAWMRVRYPKLKAEYDFLAVEKELLWPLDREGHIVDQVRCDVLARRKSDGGLFYIEWKTASQTGDEWVKQWEHNTQLLANTLAVEEMLHERVEGVLIEGLVKGRRAVDRSRTSPYFGHRIQQSPLCYGYVHQPTGEMQASYINGKGWQKTFVPAIPGMRVSTWVDTIMTAEECEAMFCPCPPIRPRREHLERWRRQTLAAEEERTSNLASIASYTDPTAKQYALDVMFPMNDDHCFRYWGHPCPFEPLCFGDQVAEDPIGSGLYQKRTPHHVIPLEVVE